MPDDTLTLDTAPPATSARVLSTELAALAELAVRHSKHSAYQALHPAVAQLFGSSAPPAAGKGEAERWRYLLRHVAFDGARVLDIGANTGFFTMAALQAGAREVVCYEGNADHARFIEGTARALGWHQRLRVVPAYYGFDDRAAEASATPFDVCLCLNVLHHLGDDFGDATLAMPQARARMLAGIEHLAGVARTLVLQLGFNWQGRRERPLFAAGLKAELIDFVRVGAARHWHCDQVAVADPATHAYAEAEARTLARFDALGEFFNRPLFVMTLN